MVLSWIPVDLLLIYKKKSTFYYNPFSSKITLGDSQSILAQDGVVFINSSFSKVCLKCSRSKIALM